MAPRESAGSLQTLVERGRFRFGKRDEADPDRKLGNGRSEALRVFSQSTAKPKLVMEVFETMRGLAGDDQVSRDLETYVDSVSGQVGVKDANYGMIMREIELLRQQVGQLEIGV